MVKTFDIMKQTSPSRGYKYRSTKQEDIAKQYKITRVFTTKDLRGTLPKYITEAIKSKKYKFVQLGSTTYVSNTWGLYR